LIKPSAAKWVVNIGSAMALLMYDDLRELADARSALLEFPETAYTAEQRWPVRI
jgi:hypothetical protein